MKAAGDMQPRNSRARRMLSRISNSASRPRLESIDRVPLGAGPDLRLQAAAIGYIDASREDAGDVLDDRDILEEADLRFGSELDHYIDIALRRCLSTRDRTEQGRMPHTPPAQLLLMRAQHR